MRGRESDSGMPKFMGGEMSVIKTYTGPDGNETDYAFFYCPGCQHPHAVRTNGNYRWEWNLSVEKPTFSPSLLVIKPDPNNQEIDLERCHSYVIDGKIKFLSDCTHDLRGKTVDLPEFPEDWKIGGEEEKC